MTSLIFAGLFVALAAFNVWTMLTTRGATVQSRARWRQAHRAAGYAFIALFLVMSFVMMMRIKGMSDELPPRIVVHMLLALLLAPLLIVKVILVRYGKPAHGLLAAVGIAIFAIAFGVVAMNAFVHFLQGASSGPAPLGVTIAVVATAIVLAGLAFFVPAGHPRTRPATTETVSQPVKVVADRLQLTLARIDPQTYDAKTLRFVLPPGQRISARPGQFLTFDWIIDGQPVRRSYSICSSPTQSGYIEITPKKVPSGYVSVFLNDRAQTGLTVTARGPYGKFCFDETKHRRIIALAGGSGITPFMAMLRYIDDVCVEVTATLIYCVRTPDDVLFRDELAGLEKRLTGFRYVPVLSQAPSGWSGWSGHLRREMIEREIEQPLESTFFLCGPQPFMDNARALLLAMGVSPANILQESFGATKPQRVAVAAGATPVQVTLLRAGASFAASSAETLLASSDSNGGAIPFGCRQGRCGTCATKLLTGEVQMDAAEALTDDMRSDGYILPCVSRPLTDLTLDA